MQKSIAGINDIMTDFIHITYDGNQKNVKLSSPTSEDFTFQIYTIEGMKLVESSEKSFSTASFSKGIDILSAVDKKNKLLCRKKLIL